jgi:hypothetical protein
MMRVILILAAACAVSSTANAAPRDMFDLVCTGQQQTATGKPPAAWKEHFRFDLENRRWCRGSCKTAAQIDQVTPDTIQIYDSRTTTGGPADVQMTLSRTDGSIREAVAAGWSGSTFGIAEGKCTRQAYSGLPGQKF